MGLFSRIRGRLQHSGTKADKLYVILWQPGELVDFIDADNNIKTGRVRAYIGGASYLQYYIQVGGETKVHLVIEPKIWLAQQLPRTKANTDVQKNAKG